jgi:DNA-binding response OmpR family regulator
MKQVWIVDDDEAIARAVQLMCRLLNYESRWLPGARPAAQALLSGQVPDLILLDINMPQVSGLELLEFLRSRQEFKEVPVVMLSSETADVLVDRALRLGADAYLAKPAIMDELSTAIQKAFLAHGIHDQTK